MFKAFLYTVCRMWTTSITQHGIPIVDNILYVHTLSVFTAVLVHIVYEEIHK